MPDEELKEENDGQNQAAQGPLRDGADEPSSVGEHEFVGDAIDEEDRETFEVAEAEREMVEVDEAERESIEVEPAHYEIDLDTEPAFSDQLTEARDNRTSPLILGAAVIGLLVGLFVWGSLAMSVMSSGGDGLDDLTAEGTLADALDDGALECSDFGPDRNLSPELEAEYQEQCVTPESGDGGTDATPSPPVDQTNRADCDAIRGTPYRSAAERDWFLANCLGG